MNPAKAFSTNRMPSLLLLGIWFALVACHPSDRAGKDQNTPVYSSQIDSARLLVKELMQKSHVPGMAVSVAVGGKLIWSEGFGFADMENQLPVDPSRTLFRIGSVSKTLTATALGLLMDDGKINVDTTLQVYVPEFPQKKYPITTRQVAGHIAGIRHYRGNEMMSSQYYPTVREGLEIFQDDTLLFEPGTQYSYSSYGWNLVSAVVENVAGEPFLSYMESHVFAPLGMSHTLADRAGTDIPDRARFYVIENDEAKPAPYVDNSYKWAGGGFIATSEDLVQFGIAHLKPDFLTYETYEALTATQYLSDQTATGYGMGWFTGTDDRGYRYIGHSGGSVGGITQFWVYPQPGIVVAMVSNGSPLAYGDTDNKIAWLFMP